MRRKSKIEKEYEIFEAKVKMIAEEETKKIVERVEKLKEDAKKIGEEIDGSLTGKRVKREKSNTN